MSNSKTNTYFFHQLERLFLGIATMNNKRHLGLLCQPQLGLERLYLNIHVTSISSVVFVLD